MDQELLDLFRQVAGHYPDTVTALKAHASERQIFRVSSADFTAVGVVNSNKAENRSFVQLSRFFHQCGLSVPEIYSFHENEELYLEEDLGDVTLYDLFQGRACEGGILTPELREHYRAVIGTLPRFQIEFGSKVDSSWFYEETEFGERAIRNDLKAFHDEFLTRSGESFDSNKLQDDFDALTNLLLGADRSYFMYRDFQSRNILIRDGKPWFIDYQAGRWGPLQYDVISLLHQLSVGIGEEQREELLDYYLSEAERYTLLDRKLFRRYYSGFLMMRLAQVMSVYGREGLGKGKEYFSASIPPALEAACALLDRAAVGVELSELRRIVSKLKTTLGNKPAGGL